MRLPHLGREASACGSGCGCQPTRRDALKLLGAAAASVALNPGGPARAMAGPFERADFDRLVPADKKLSPQWIRSLFERGTPAVYRGDELKYIGMPVGGICSGQLYLGGDGKLWLWDLFNGHQRTGAGRYAHPDKHGLSVQQGFALRVTAGGKTQTRTLDAGGFPHVSFRGQYPIGTVEYTDAGFPVSVVLEAFSPFIPLNVDDSSLPATVLRFTMTNTSKEPAEATLAGWLQNAVLPNTVAASATRRNRIVRDDGLTFLACSADKSTASTQPAEPDVTFESWTKDNYEGWTVEGSAFGARPAKRSEVPAYMGDIGAAGDRFVNSHVSAPGGNVGQRDAQTGTLTSKPFTVERNFILFPIGGGNHPAKTCVNVIVDGQVVRSAVGANDNRMTPHALDVRAFRGKQARIQIVDRETGPWGNIGVGAITFSDHAPGSEDPKKSADYGTMGLALIGGPADYCSPGPVAPPEVFAGQKADEASAPSDRPLLGAIGRTIRLDAGRSVTVDFAITWHFPNLHIDRLGDVGRHYAVRFDSALAVARYVAKEFPRLSSLTKLWRDTWYDSTLPYWFLDRTLLNISTLATSTVYRFADGRFYSWEGVGCCPGTCTHVWHYAQAVARLFPELERITRENVDLKIGFNEATGVIGFRAEFDRGLAVDGQSGTLLRCYREHQMSPDDSFLKRNWPRIKKAYEPLLSLDPDGDGIMEGAQMNTLDKPWYGKVAWLSSLYVAALLAGEQMSRERGDAGFADRCRAIADRGAQSLVAQLFDGEYFINKVDPKHLKDINSGTGCEIDQVFGQSWAFQVGLGRALPEGQTRSALRSLWKYNFTPDVGPYRKAYKPGRWYAMPGEAGLLMCTFPRSDWDYSNAHGSGGAEWAAGYFNECMNGFEHQVAGHMIWEGMVQEGLAVERAIHDRYHPSRRNPWNEVECGDHYARSMASYGVFLAACGYAHHGPDGLLAFAPRLTPENFKAAFTTARGWGSFEQKYDAQSFSASIAQKYGQLRLRELRLELPEGQKPRAVQVSLDGKPVAAKLAVQGGRAVVTFEPQVRVLESQTLRVVIA